MKILDIFRRGKVDNATLKEPEWWRQMVLSGPTGSGVYVNEDSALKISAVYACIRVLSETMAGLPVGVYRNTKDGRESVDHSLNQLLGVSPNSIQTGFELTEGIMLSLGLGGSAYNQKLLDGRGNVGEIIPLQHKFIKVDHTAKGLIFDYQAPGESRTFTQEEIWRISGLSCNGVTGLSPIGVARESLGIASASEESAARMYSNGAQIPGVLEYPNKMDEEIIKRLRQQWADNQAGSKNAGKPLILESGMKYTATGMSAKDAQFLEARKFQIAEIARWYRVPLHKLNELDRATFSNIEHQSIEFVTDTILPWARRIEQSIQRDLFSNSEKKNLFVRFNLEGLLRGDTESRHEAYGKAITDGWMSRNEVRRLENRNPVDGLDEYLIPLNMAGAREENNRISNYLATKEINALNNAKNEDLESWAVDFYTRHAENMKELSGLDKELCANFAVSRIETIKNGGLKEAKSSAIQKTQEAINA